MISFFYSIVTISLNYFDLEIKYIIKDNSAIKNFIFDKPEEFITLNGRFCSLTLLELRKGNDNFTRVPRADGFGSDEIF